MTYIYGRSCVDLRAVVLTHLKTFASDQSAKVSARAATTSA
jgi:hypothetical protein